jgi:hypothetical protein
VRSLEINRRRDPAFERLFPARNANAPAITRLQARKTPLPMRSDQIVPHQDRVIEKVTCHLRANCMQANVLRSGPAITVAIKSGRRLPATGAQLTPENVRRHGGTVAAGLAHTMKNFAISFSM